MNFFESQARARRNTLTLVILFVLAVCSLILLINLVVMSGFAYHDDPVNFSFVEMWRDIDWGDFGLVALVVWLVVLTGSISKIMDLSGGGRIIAESMGGRLIMQNTDNAQQKRLLNVVHEMAIASGTPAPPVYLLQNEHGINAFAAGYSPRDAVIAVTQGMVKHLNREQLQGVIAHEFSHIFNGDMRLNIQLLGMIHGILVIGSIGYEMMSLPFRARIRADKDTGFYIILLLLLGLALFVIGYTGTFFGNMIKAAVSRQREFLADASAVQFTRNPQAIAGALKKIGGLGMGSRMHGHSAVEISHALFADGIPRFMSVVFATHPPLEERIRRIEPGWNGKFLKPTSYQAAPVSGTEGVSAFSGKADLSRQQALDNAVEQMGNPSPQTVSEAHRLLREVPAQVRQEAADPFGARAVVYALLLDADYSIRVKQLDYLARNSDREVYRVLNRVMDPIDRLGDDFRLALIDLSMPALKQLSNRQYQDFGDDLSVLAEADGKLDLFEWSLHKIVLNYLNRQFYPGQQGKVKSAQLPSVQLAMELLISLLAISGHRSRDIAEQAYQVTMKSLGYEGSILIESKRLNVRRLNLALSTIQGFKASARQRLLSACIACIEYDGQVTRREMEMLRAFSSAIDCPIPLIVGQRSERQSSNQG